MSVTPTKLTAKQYLGLHALAQHGRMRRSNHTNNAAKFLYWQTADALTAAGYAQQATTHVVITDAGIERLRPDHRPPS